MTERLVLPPITGSASTPDLNFDPKSQIEAGNVRRGRTKMKKTGNGRGIPKRGKYTVSLGKNKYITLLNEFVNEMHATKFYVRGFA